MPHAYTLLLREHILDEKTNQVKYVLEETPNLPTSNKVYGNLDNIIDRTFVHYENIGNATTGIMALGHPGTGKTVLVNRLSQRCREEFKLPSILITKAPSELSWARVDEGDGGLDFIKFIQDLPPCLLILEEFEKTFEIIQQEKLLTMYDGMFTSKKMIIHTANNIHKISSKLIGRPNRIHFKITHGSIGPDFIRDYCFDNLDDTSKIEEIIEQSFSLDPFTVDQLRALIFTINNHNESIYESFKFLNIESKNFHSNIIYTASVIRIIDNKSLKVIPPNINVPPPYDNDSRSMGIRSLEIPSSVLKNTFINVVDPDKVDEKNPKGHINVNLSECSQECNEINNTVTIRYKDEYIFKFEKEKTTQRLDSNAYS